MIKAFKTELYLNESQMIRLKKTIGVCRYVYNLYLITQKEHYEVTGKFFSGFDFSKWLNNTYITNNPDKSWIKEVSSKAVKQSIMNAERAFKRFFNKQSKYPKFKKKGKKDCGVYLPKNSDSDLRVQRHRIKIPTFGWVRLKEYGYLPTDATIKSCTLTLKAGRCFVSVLTDVPGTNQTISSNAEGVGIDLGINKFATVSSGNMFENINKSKKVRDIEKKLKREQRSLSRKILKRKRGEFATKTRANMDKNILRVQSLYFRLACIREEYVKSVVNTLVKTKPEYITIEDLNIRGMVKNRHLSKAIASQLFYRFRTYLIDKCKQLGIEVRLANKFYASSKTCSSCGYINRDLKLKDRVYKCPNCGMIIDRDLNASLNLQGLKEYTVLT